MYGNCDKKQNCLNVNVSKLNEGIKVRVQDISKQLYYYNLSHTDKCCNRKTPNNNTLHFQLLDTLESKITCSLVCTASELKKILEVSPDIIYLNEYNNYTENTYIVSNVTWEI